jgi:hypothetical protein
MNRIGSSVATPVSGVGETAYAAKLGVVAKAGPWMVEVGSPAVASAPDAAETGYIAVTKALIAALH